MDAPGWREELRDMARRLATAGYYVVLPNLYYRSTREFNIFAGNGETRAQMFALMASLTDDLVAADTQAMFDFVDADPAAASEHIGCVGYCMSGPFSFAMAGMYPQRVRAAASVYGVRLFGDGSPAHLAERVTGELYFACAEFDEYAPNEMIDALEAHLASLPIRSRVERYPGTHHGFAFPGRGELYSKLDAERHWERLHSLFDRNLRGRAA
jgi:carboxymethylenebutenolidase